MQPAANKIGESTATKKSARRDLTILVVLFIVAAVVVLSDPNKIFEWLAGSEQVQFDESLVILVLLGVGFAVFSWRRWTELSIQVAEYRRLQTEMSQINREASLMSETDDLLQSCVSSAEAYKVIIRHIQSQLPAASGAICTITNARDLVEVVAHWGQPAMAENLFSPKDCWALRRGRINRLGPGSQPICSHIGLTPPQYGLCVPMVAQGETLGILYLDSGKPDGKHGAPRLSSLSESEERVVRTLAEHLALAVANLNLRETLRTQSIRDPLTSLFNRRYMEESLDRELRRASRRTARLAVLMVDIDHFKRINDSYGHEAGDTLLREIARLLSSRLRGEDIACRYGGEEFTLIIPETTLDSAVERAEQLRQAAQQARVDYRGKELPQISVSIGVACFPQHGATGDALLRTADRALYLAKAEGRNRVVVADAQQPSLASATSSPEGSP